MIPIPITGTPLRPYALARTEVTAADLRALMPDYRPADDPHLPARGLNWYLAAAYATWVGARLPTRAEWENAARPLATGGTCRRRTLRPLEAVAWHGDTPDATPHPVATLAPCRGLYDLLGNARELLAAAPPGCDVIGHAYARGGGFRTRLDGIDIDVSGRFMGGHAFDAEDLGLRLAIDLE